MNERLKFSGCVRSGCKFSRDSNHFHSEDFRAWQSRLTPAQQRELGNLAQRYQRSLSFVAKHFGVTRTKGANDKCESEPAADAKRAS
jgi:hypothetical protein